MLEMKQQANERDRRMHTIRVGKTTHKTTTHTEWQVISKNKAKMNTEKKGDKLGNCKKI